MGWQVGDLALCVRAEGTRLAVGKIYLVSEVWVGGTISHGFAHNWTGVGLRFGFEERDVNWCATRFRKIRPHTPDAEDAETIRLLTGAPVLEPVS